MVIYDYDASGGKIMMSYDTNAICLVCKGHTLFV